MNARVLYGCDDLSLNSSHTKAVQNTKSCTEYQNTHFIFNNFFFSKNRFPT
jgi:hypothetical protein